MLSVLLCLPRPSLAQISDGNQAQYGYTYAPLCTSMCGNITWSATGVPSGITATYNPTVTAWNGTTTLTITVGSSTPPGIYGFGQMTQCSEFVCGGTIPITIVVTPTGIQMVGKDAGSCHAGTVKCADPIDIGTGNVFESALDYQTHTQNQIQLIRYYNSRPSATGASVGGAAYYYPFNNWRTNFDRDLFVLAGGNVAIVRPDGQLLYFTKAGNSYFSDTDVNYTLTTNSFGNVYYVNCPDDSVESYFIDGYDSSQVIHLQSIKYRGGYTQNMTRISFAAGDFSNVLGSVTDSYNRTLTFHYNSSGQVTSVSTPDSTTIDYGYTASGLLNTVTFPTSPTSTITYNYGENSAPATALTSVLDENGHTYKTWTYDANSRGLTNYLGGSGLSAGLTTVTYNDTNGSRTVTNALGVTDTYSFSALQNAPKVTGISRAATSTTAAATESFAYDSNGYLNSFTDWNGNQTTYVNNTAGFPTTINEAVGSPVARTTTVTYDTTWTHQPKTVVTPGVTTGFTFDSNGNPLTQTFTDTTSQSIPYSTNGQTRTWTFTWSNFLLASVQSPRTDVTATTNYGYDNQSTFRSITDALGHVTNVTMAQTGGYPQKVVDPNSVTRDYSWDARQRLVYDQFETSAGNDVTYYNRDATGEITQIFPPDSTYRNFAYDTAHRLIKVTDPYSNVGQYTLDSLGDPTQTEIENGSTEYKNHTATFDALGRRLTDVGGQGQTTTLTYDKDGNALTVKDGVGNQTTRVFDALNRLSKSTDANTGVAQWTYDAHDRPLTVVDQNGHTTSYVYDGFGDVIQETSPDRGTTVYHYDNNGNLTSKTDALSVVTNQTFDKLDRVLTTTYPADSTLNIAYTYDQTGTGFSFGIGRLTSVTDQAGTLTRAYDERGNLLTEKRVNGGNTYTTSYTYNSASRILSTTYPDSTVVNFAYDGPGSVYTMSAKPAGASTATTIAPNINHFPFGPLQYISYGNGMTETWFFDLDYRVTGISANLGNITQPHVMQFSYTYDAANNLKTITDGNNSANSQTLGYDVLNRINTAVSGTGGYGSYTYTFDAVGNLSSLKIGATTTNYSYTTGTNRLSAIGSTTVSTNANGNITSVPIVGGMTAATFTYSKANRLSGASGGGITNAITGIVYDAFGRRFSKAHSAGSPELYFYDQQGELLAENISGVYTDYAWVDGIPLAVISPTATPSANQIAYVSTDRIGTPQMAFNSSQTSIWSTTYQPFGQGGMPISSIVNDARLPGQTYDMETGFHYNLFRDYMPNLGRYLEADPVGLVGGLSVFSYVFENPFKHTDRKGLQEEDERDPREEEVEQENETNWSAFNAAEEQLRNIDPNNPRLIRLTGPNWNPTEEDIDDIQNEIYNAQYRREQRANERECYLYQKLDSNERHLKFGVTYSPDARYTQDELDGGRLRIIGEGSRSDMLQLERDLHGNLPIGPEEGQQGYINQQVQKGLLPPPYGTPANGEQK